MKLVASLLFIGLFVPISAGQTEPDSCEPTNAHPIGRCGAYDGEVIFFCFVRPAGVMVNATEEPAYAVAAKAGLGVTSPVDLGPTQIDVAYYLRDSPGLPHAYDVYHETNEAPRFQPTWSRCGPFTWDQEFEIWFYDVETNRTYPPDDDLHIW